MNRIEMQALLMNYAPTAFMAAVGLLLIWFLYRYFWKAPDELDAQHEKTAPVKQMVLFVLGWLVLSRLLIFGVCYAGYELDMGRTLDVGTWIRWDAKHYLGLANNWYQNEGDPRLHIVFYPLYPILIRALKPLLMGHELVAAFAASNACLALCGLALFRLVEGEQGTDAARRAVRYLMLCPVSLFFSLPYSESLFLALTLGSVLMARREKMWLAILFGALASATRMLGLLCAVPVFYAFIRRARKQEGAAMWRGLATGFACTCLIATGFLAYLVLNKVITGDWFRFLVYQREHWSQTFGSLGNSVKYTLENLFNPSNDGVRYGIWLPQIVAMAAVLAVVGATVRRAQPADAAYALLYYYIALAPTWLLSGPRYLGGMYALYPMLALMTRRRWQDGAITGLLVLGLGYCVYQYTVVGSMF